MIADLFEIKTARKYRYGHGLFATQLIPKGTITDFRCEKCGTYSKEELSKLPKKELRFVMDHEVMKKSGLYTKFCDRRMLYDNHSCNANNLNAHVLSPGLGGIGIAVRDIQKGEEATSDYRLNEEETVHFVGGCKCGEKDCMGKTFRSPAPKKLQRFWNRKINAALKLIPHDKEKREQEHYEHDQDKVKVVEPAEPPQRLYDYAWFLYSGLLLHQIPKPVKILIKS